MHIQFNTGHNTDGNDKLAEHVADVVRSDLGNLADHVTRVEVHLSDPGGDALHEMRCMMEARLEGKQPIAVDHQSDSIHQVVGGASKKLKRVVANALRAKH
ncbi:MAG: hypothetical protein ACJATT_003456 [Myxococcota bacterium]|jgi:hypothetical protein